MKKKGRRLSPNTRAPPAPRPCNREGEERGIGSRREKNKWEGLGSYRYETSREKSREKEKDD
jgi:hypothetical protein